MQPGATVAELARRYRLKRMAQRLLRPDGDAVIVASIGRSGSTLVYDAIARALAAAQPVQIPGVTVRAVRDVAWDLSAARFRRGICYKTHDLPSALQPRPHLRAVFLFGSAYDAALSVHRAETTRGPAWVAAHLRHLNAPGPAQDLLHADVLGIAAQVNAWARCTQIPTLCLRYETLWQHANTLSTFCGLPVHLPPQRARALKAVPADLQAQAHRTYDPIDHDLAGLPDGFVAGSIQKSSVSMPMLS